MCGNIVSIQRFCVNDGPGIRTTVFFKGCPLHCLWCHNPESQDPRNELFFDPDNCVLCGGCAAVCPQECHTFGGGAHVFARQNCIGCGRCAEVCPASAIEPVGRQMSADEILSEVMKDAPFYRNSGGGITLSGGEPMMQFAFVSELLTKAKENGLHVCMETCGYAPWEHYLSVAPLVDVFLVDWKLSDDDAHRRYTGVSNRPILENLTRLDALGKKLVLRCPIIPGINDTEEHLIAIAHVADRLKNCTQIELEPYHPLGESKARRLGKPYPLAGLPFPEEDTVSGWLSAVSRSTDKPVKKA